ncbi:MAG: efflux RND transporter periplasmic adaptor subunit, partial [Myxococcota bacterium]
SSETEHSPNNGEWCAGHSIPESHCTKCHPELVDEFKEKGDWCAEHGFPESKCPTCNPATPPGEAKAAAHGPDNGEWCAGHSIPESHCTKCHPELVDEFKEKGDWCAEHGFPESKCPTCNPATPPGEAGSEDGAEEHSADNGEWCKGHGLPESHCTKCHPELVDEFKEKGDWCAEHGFPESKCPQCNPATPPAGAAKPIPGVPPGSKIVFKDKSHEKTVGIETMPARDASVAVGAEAPARIEYNMNAFADVRASVPGIVRDVRVDLGESVEKGDVIFVLESARVGETQAQIRSARQQQNVSKSNAERKKKLYEKDLTSKRELELAEQDYENATATLRSLEESLRLSGSSSRSTGGRYVVRAPLSGTVVKRPGVVGSFATEETSLASIADTATVWAMLDVPERDSFALQQGQGVQLAVDGAGDRTFGGEITWISPEVDSRTRTIKARAEIDNADGRLRANQFAEATIGIEPGSNGLVVPRDAIQRFDDVSVVFVRLERGTYEPRVVEPLHRTAKLVQVRGDLKKGDEVVTTGGFILKTELSRDSIGAGCCEVPEE